MVVVENGFIMAASLIMNAQITLYMILEDATIKGYGGIMMNSENKKKFDTNIKAINRELKEISEGKLQSDELVSMQFKAIRSLIDDCENLTTTK